MVHHHHTAVSLRSGRRMQVASDESAGSGECRGAGADSGYFRPKRSDGLSGGPLYISLVSSCDFSGNLSKPAMTCQIRFLDIYQLTR